MVTAYISRYAKEGSMMRIILWHMSHDALNYPAIFRFSIEVTHTPTPGRSSTVFCHLENERSPLGCLPLFIELVVTPVCLSHLKVNVFCFWCV